MPLKTLSVGFFAKIRHNFNSQAGSVERLTENAVKKLSLFCLKILLCNDILLEINVLNWFDLIQNINKTKVGFGFVYVLVVVYTASVRLNLHHEKTTSYKSLM